MKYKCLDTAILFLNLKITPRFAIYRSKFSDYGRKVCKKDYVVRYEYLMQFET